MKQVSGGLINLLTALHIMSQDPRDEPGYISPDTLDHTPIGFGKYRELTPAQISEQDPKYLVWVYEKVLNRGQILSDVLYRECVKAPAPPRFKSGVGHAPAPRYQPGSVAESRSHFGKYDDEDDDVPF